MFQKKSLVAAVAAIAAVSAHAADLDATDMRYTNDFEPDTQISIAGSLRAQGGDVYRGTVDVLSCGVPDGEEADPTDPSQGCLYDGPFFFFTYQADWEVDLATNTLTATNVSCNDDGSLVGGCDAMPTGSTSATFTQQGDQLVMRFVQNFSGFIDNTYYVTFDFPRLAAILPLETNAEGCVEAAGPDGTAVDLSADTSILESDGNYTLNWLASNGDTGSGVDFTTQIGIDETANVQLTVTDNDSGESDATDIDVCVSDTVAPEIVILSPDQGDTVDPSGGVVRWEIHDVADPNVDSAEMLIAEKRNTESLPNGQFIQALRAPTTGASSEIEITIRAEDASGNQVEESISVNQQATTPAM